MQFYLESSNLKVTNKLHFTTRLHKRNNMFSMVLIFGLPFSNYALTSKSSTRYMCWLVWWRSSGVLQKGHTSLWGCVREWSTKGQCQPTTNLVHASVRESLRILSEISTYVVWMLNYLDHYDWWFYIPWLWTHIHIIKLWYLIKIWI